MEKDFDFKNIGKQMPYRTPDGFFDRMQEQVLARAGVERRKKQHRIKLIVAVALTAAAMLTGLFFTADTDRSYSEAMDSFIAEMPDEELNEWVELSECDVFMD